MKYVFSWVSAFLFLFFAVYTGKQDPAIVIHAATKTHAIPPAFSVDAKTGSQPKYFIRTQQLSSLFNINQWQVNPFLDKFHGVFHLYHFWDYFKPSFFNPAIAFSIFFKIQIIFPFHAFW